MFGIMDSVEDPILSGSKVSHPSNPTKSAQTTPFNAENARLYQCVAVGLLPHDDGRKSWWASFISATTLLNVFPTCLATSFLFHSPLVFQMTSISLEYTCSSCSTLNPDVRSVISS